MILVTGSTGELGKETLNALMKLQPSQDIHALVRNPEKAIELAETDIALRKGDYSDYDSILEAFSGIERLLIISAPAFSDQNFESNIVLAAKKAGVKYIIYTGIQRNIENTWNIPGVTERDQQMEVLLEESGIEYSIAHNALYTDVLPFLLGKDVLIEGVLFPSGDGSAPFATRSDLGEALARMINSDKIFPKHITLSNSQSWSRYDLSQMLSEISGKNVLVIDTSAEEYIAYQEKLGIPPFYAKFAAEWAFAMDAGEFKEADLFMENILGRKPIDVKTFLQSIYSN